MTATERIPTQALLKLASGFLLGVIAIPIAILLTQPRADEVSDREFYDAPRETRLDLLNEVSAKDRDDRRVLVGSSIIEKGFQTPVGGDTARFGLNWMRIDETIEIIGNLLDRPKPPTLVIVDWAALHDVPHLALGLQETPELFSLDYLRFAITLRLSDQTASERRGNATWQHPGRNEEFQKGNIERLLEYGALFEEFSQVPRFASALSDLCKGRDTRFVIVRFPVFTQGNEQKVQDYFNRLATTDLEKALAQITCDVKVVDLLAESLGEDKGQSEFQSDRGHWYDFNHFKPEVGDAILDDERFGGTGVSFSAR